MSRWLKWMGIAAAGLMATTALAADHTDGPAVTGNDAADINDVYAWLHTDGEKIVMIQTIGGITAASFSPAVQYVFHVGRDATQPLTAEPADWTNVICEFESGTSVQCWVDNGNAAGAADYVNGDPTPAAGIGGVNGNITVHAAQHADPFFFYLGGLNNARGYLRFLATNSVLPSPNGEGCYNLDVLINGGNCLGQTYASVTRGLLDGTYSSQNCDAGMAVNTFEDINVSALVVELDKSVIAGTGEYYAVYASTHIKN